MQEVLATVVASPEFLYLMQTTDIIDTGKQKKISDMEFATRLSFFLWASIPDAELLGIAHQGKLRNPEVLKVQIARMLKAPKAKGSRNTLSVSGWDLRDWIVRHTLRMKC